MAMTRRKDLAIQKSGVGEYNRITVSSVVIKQKERKGEISSLYGIMSLLLPDEAHTTPHKVIEISRPFNFIFQKLVSFAR